ncbi:MAG TPA: sugar kinase [Candidatus Latescibacteria bacterium]|nr:sugar kinase [Candidatus Latescibacterota bacterium]
MTDVVCLGILVADVMGKPIDTIPAENRLALFEKMELHIGGCAANTGIALTRLGARVRVVGKVGADGFGDFILNTLKENNIDANWVVRDPEAGTPFTFAMISSKGKRRFLHCLGTNATFNLSDIDLRSIRSTRILHIAGTYLMPRLDGEGTAQVLREAKRAGVKTSLDTAYNDQIQNWERIITPSLPYIDYFLPSVEEAQKITGETSPERMAAVLKDICPGVVGIKLGPKGFLLKTDRIEKVIPPYEVRVIDTSGAGDAFVAGFLRGVLEGWDFEECARLGNAVASFCIRAIGCTAGVRPLGETLEFMRKKVATTS